MILPTTAVLTAVWLGILTSISRCPLATNVAAMSFFGKARVFLCGTCREALRQIGESSQSAEVVADAPAGEERDAVGELSRRSG